MLVEAGHDAVLCKGLSRQEDSSQAVIVLDGNRIILVVVAPCATKCHSHEGPAGGVDLLIDNVAAHLGGIVTGVLLGTYGEDPDTEGLGTFLFKVIRGQQVTGKLLNNEPVKGLVVIEGGDDVVAVTECDRVDNVLVHAVGIGVAGDIQPVPSPAFPVAGGGEQLVNQPLPGIRSVVFKEGLQLCARRGKPVQVEISATHQDAPMSFPGGMQSRLLDFLEDEVIQGNTGPGWVTYRWLHRLGRQDKSPESVTGGGIPTGILGRHCPGLEGKGAYDDGQYAMTGFSRREKHVSIECFYLPVTSRIPPADSFNGTFQARIWEWTS